MPLKFEGKFVKGNRIRAYDFEPLMGRGDSYIEGIVQEEVPYPNPAGYSYLLVAAKFRCVYGDLRETNEQIRVPLETSCDYDSRIIDV